VLGAILNCDLTCQKQFVSSDIEFASGLVRRTVLGVILNCEWIC